MTIREANKNDLTEILQLYLYLHEESVLEDTEHLRNIWENIINDENHHLIVCEVDDKIVASCVCVIIPNLTRNYEKLGFSTIKHERYPVENGVILAYEVMEKELHKISSKINYNGRKFIPSMNSENGEVSDQTVFSYHQNGNLLWAEYCGGNILKGFLVGCVLDNGELDFVYHHMNRDMQVKTGKCHSVPTVKENGKIELSEQWEWTSGDYSKGESLLVEV